MPARIHSFIQCWASKQEARQANPAPEKENKLWTNIFRKWASPAAQFPVEESLKPIGCVSKLEARTHRLHAGWGPLWNTREPYPTAAVTPGLASGSQGSEGTSLLSSWCGQYL